MNIKIKEANLEDFGILILLRLSLLEHGFKLDKKVAYNIGKIQKSVRYMKSYLKKEDNKYFIAYHDSLPVGYLHVTYDNKKEKHSSYLSELFIIDLYRHRGIGKRLIFSQWGYLKKINITENKLTTTRDKNNKTINFYKKIGYDLIKENKKKNIIYFSKIL